MGRRDRRFLKIKFDDRRSPTTREFRGILKGFYKVRFRQHFPDYFSLNTNAFAVNDPDELKTLLVGFRQILLRYSTHISRMKSVQIQRICYFDLDYFRKRISI